MVKVDRDDPVLKALRRIRDKNHKILVRPNGQIEGVIPTSGEETYSDDEWDVKRRRFTYYTLDGEEKHEPRDAYNKKVNDTESIIPIEHNGGVALTELKNPSGKLTTILGGKEATSLKERVDNARAMSNELNRIEAKLRKKDKRDVRLATKVNNLERERDELEEDIEHFRTANERLRKQAESWRQIAIGAKAELNQKKNELEQVLEAREVTAEKVKQIAQDFSTLKFSEMEIPEISDDSMSKSELPTEGVPETEEVEKESKAEEE